MLDMLVMQCHETAVSCSHREAARVTFINTITTSLGRGGGGEDGGERESRQSHRESRSQRAVT